MLGLLELSMNGAVLIAVVVLLRAALRRYLPRTAFVVLWLAAAVRLLCPVRLPSPVSVWRLFGAARAQGLPAAAVTARYPLVPAAGMPVCEALPNVCDFLGKVWLFGAALLLLGIAVVYLDNVRRSRKARPVGDGVYVCEGIGSPCLCGIVRPRILVPEGVQESLLPYILLHEKVHLRRLDNLWKLLALGAAAVHWFNPAAWVMAVLLGRDLEVSCDEWVLRGLNDGQRRAYALALITMAGRPQGRSPVVCGFLHNPLEERIRNIMTNRKKSMFALTAATAMILCTTSAFATNAPGGASADVEGMQNYDVKTGYYTVTEKGDGSECMIVSVANEADCVITGADDLEFYTAEEYAAYLEEQKVALLDEIEAGRLSQETYDMTVADMEELLAGLRDGSMMVAKPFLAEDGSEVTVSMSTPESAEAKGFDVNYEVEADGSLTVGIGEKLYSVVAEQ